MACVSWPEKTKVACPQCGKLCGVYDRLPERTWRQLPKVKAVARTLKAHLVNLLTYFQHPITNATTEGFNSKIQAIKADARGFRRFVNYRARILFFCGKLDLMPHLPSVATHSVP